MAPYVKPFKNLIFGGPFGRVSRGVVPPNYIKTFAWLISTVVKKTGALSEAVQKLIFWGVRGGFTPKISRDKIAFAAQQFYAKIRFRCFVV